MNPTIKNISIIILVALSIASCNQKKNKKLLVKENYLINIDTISIPINELYLQNYTGLRNQIYNNCLYSYNIQSHTIDIFDLTKQIFTKQILLQKDGSDGISNLNAFTILSDSIIIQNETYYTILNQEGKVFKRISKENLVSRLDHEEYLLEAPNNISISNFENLVYNNKINELIIPIGLSDPYKLKDKHCIASVNLNTEKITLLSPIYPDIFNKKYYGKHSKPQIVCIDNKIIYNFSNSSNIYLFKNDTKNTEFFEIKSDYTDNISEDLDINTKTKCQLDYYFHSLFFHCIQYDKYRNLFYRLHTDKSEDPSVFNNKETYLTIISSNMKKIKEIKLPMNLYPIFNITKKGLLFQFMKGLYEDKFSYMILTTPHITAITNVDSIENKDTIPQKIMKTTKINAEIISMKNIKEFINKQMIYPQTELENKTEGLVFIILKSDDSGSIYSCDISETATTTENKGLREEALRIGKLIKRVEPNSLFSFHVVFNIGQYKQNKLQ